MEILKKINLILALPLIVLIKVYQITLSPDHSWIKMFFPHGYCKFYPSCSMYAKATLEKRGLLGIPNIIRRLLWCNPFTNGGIDLPYSEYQTK